MLHCLIIATDTEGPTGWKYPKLQELRRFQEKRGLTYSALNDVEVCEIICGVSTTQEIEKFHEWITEHLKNQGTLTVELYRWISRT